MKEQEIIDKFSLFLIEIYYKELALAITEGKKSFQVDFSKLDKFDPLLADVILEDPNKTLTLIEDSLEQIDITQNQPYSCVSCLKA